MSIILKAFLIGTAALLVTVFMIVGTVTLTGDTYQPTMFINSVIGCYAIGSTVSYYFMKQSEKYRQALQEKEALHVQLIDAHEKLRRHSQLDIMTGLLNREAFFTKVNRLKEAFSDQSSSMLILDIDHFKLINDTFGHLEGDKAIIMVSKVLRTIVDKDVIVGRIGGEEFAVFIRDIKAENVRVVAESLRAAIEEIEFYPVPEIRQKLTVSIGAAQAENTGVTTDLVRRADRTLYKAKNEGRNCVCMDMAA
ncbi:GGDEF domain-containing protein [Ahrensia kielensis]|uniref:diguanylate cyclase n=1 Tax=Ahrensia kielensis TaxID=76980 RepID=A0ABU9T9V0_9HYPH